MGAGKSKAVLKAEKASVRATATEPGPIRIETNQKIDETDKANKLAKAAKGKAKSAAAVPGSFADRKGYYPSTSKSMAKRVNQSRVARGGKPRPLYISKAEAGKFDAIEPGREGPESLGERQTHRNGPQWKKANSKFSEKAESDKKSSGPKY